MRDAHDHSRRSFLAGTGAAVLTAVAGCQGDGGGPQGENSSGGNGGAPEIDQGPQPTGELVRTETITKDTEWEIDLDGGDTMTVVLEVEEGGSGEIRPTGRIDRLASIQSASNPDWTFSMQHTAEESRSHTVDVRAQQRGEVRVYVQAG